MDASYFAGQTIPAADGLSRQINVDFPDKSGTHFVLAPKEMRFAYGTRAWRLSTASKVLTTPGPLSTMSTLPSKLRVTPGCVFPYPER